MAVITISRELGSGGMEVAQQVAQALGYQYVDKSTTDTVFRQYGLTKFDELYSSAPSFLDLLNAENLLHVAMANEVVEAVAKHGNVVILGRAGFAVLKGYADVLHVRLEAPITERVRRVMAREGLTDSAAVEARIHEDDNVHRMYVKRFYNQQWDAHENFDLVLDTGTLGIDAAVAQIVVAAQALGTRPQSSNVATTANLAVDTVLADTVTSAMA